MSEAKSDAKSTAKAVARCDAKSTRSSQACHTRSETFGSAASSTISAARRRAALSKLAAEQGQRAAAAKAELTRQEAETQAERARQEAETHAERARQEAERARQEAELARQRAALEAQQLADEAERRQLELELLEEEEYGHQSSAVDRQALARPAAAAPSEPAAQLREPLLTGERFSRTRDWVEQSSQYGLLTSARPYDDRHQQEPRRPLQPCLHYDADISAATNVTAVISKLPAALALKWGEHAVHSGLVRPTLADLDSWLRRYVAAGLEVLLGADVIELIVAREVIDGPPGAPCAVRTLLGWTVTGRAPDQNLPVNKDVHHIRVSEETQDASEVTRWQHVPESLNSSNLGSRGCSVAEVAPGGEWGQGRAVLSRRPEDRPAAPPRPTERPRDEETAEMRAPACVTRGAEPAINPSRFSSRLRLLRVTAWARRFAHNSHSRAVADRRTGPLTAEELREAERVWLLSTQAEQFGDEIAALQHGRRLPSNSQLHRLNPFLDSNGLLRVGGQLRHAQLDFKVKRRVILPARGDITRLIVTDRHKKLAHSGAEHILAHLRHHFWVISGRAAVKRYSPTCMPCRKRRPSEPNEGGDPA
ncbi:hypothetical protein FJT64_018198 [Amphibalanus amphitrite]|uniref:Integrase zinc-binding domain-containing protein n=1 Tax=Amphibalanus amphitrite TaxID=1232801 RepID=A0A6A4X079_AMPAM|nr:hypothetical protein FJT64_018198 [Amphibalanus amphitrite]